MQTLVRDLNLQIDDLDADKTLGPAVRDYYRLLKDYMGVMSQGILVIETRERYVGI